MLEVRDGGALVSLPSAKERTLLAALLLRPNEPLSVDVLAEQLWPERPPQNPQKSLQIHVSRLRRRLGPNTIQTTPAGYLLQLEPAELDAAVFELAADEGLRLLEAGRAAEALNRL